MKFKPGDIVPATTLEAVTGEAIRLPDPNRLVHLQFRRFVDCPICNTHIAESPRACSRDRSGRHQGGDRLSFLRQIDPLVPEGCSFRDGRRSEEGALQRIRRRNLARVHEPQGPGGRNARDGAWPFRLAAFGRPSGAPGDFLIAPSGRINAAKYGDPCL